MRGAVPFALYFTRLLADYGVMDGATQWVPKRVFEIRRRHIVGVEEDSWIALHHVLQYCS